MRRTRSPGVEAVVSCEEMGKSSREAPRRMGPGARTRIAGIMSGRAVSRPGLTATGKDLPYRGTEIGRRDSVCRMSS